MMNWAFLFIYTVLCTHCTEVLNFQIMQECMFFSFLIFITVHVLSVPISTHLMSSKGN